MLQLHSLHDIIDDAERIVMTPVVKEIGRTVLRIERKQLAADKNQSFTAQTGMVINKQAANSGE